ncbi:hypothetical protein L7F22_020049 [Adiantum nelumboides]|nr:hypothetical protein [Adiantum nelumboides]
MAGQDQFELKFRLTDGTDIGPNSYPPVTTVATLKESILAQWPRDNANGPKTIGDMTLINAGKILENNKTLAESSVPVGELSAGVITMHVLRTMKDDPYFILFKTRDPFIWAPRFKLATHRQQKPMRAAGAATPYCFFSNHDGISSSYGGMVPVRCPGCLAGAGMLAPGRERPDQDPLVAEGRSPCHVVVPR